MTDNELTPERLREWGGVFSGIADAWDRDRREIGRLRAERDTLRENWQRCTEYAARLEGERDRLREALEEIAEHNDAGRHDGLPEPCPVYDAETMFGIAREALNTTEEKLDE